MTTLGMSKMAIQSLLTWTGGHLSPLLLHKLDAVLDYLEVGRWMTDRHLTAENHYTHRHELFRDIGSRVADERVLYLEFGVWRGDATRQWAKLLRHPDSRLHGFDSFEGLPTDWTPAMPAGHFSTAGEVPAINDERIQFFKGWFHETLPEYEWPGDYDRLIVVMDADLYEPTLYVLNFIADRITPGTLLFFDEFKDRNHELRAFSEFLRNHPMQLRVVGARKQLDFVMFECVR